MLFVDVFTERGRKAEGKKARSRRRLENSTKTVPGTLNYIHKFAWMGERKMVKSRERTEDLRRLLLMGSGLFNSPAYLS